jgi:ribosomal protein S12 methylthiotransferase accessory factor
VEATEFRFGTFRTKRPEETWCAIVPLLPRFGVTRVADITKLDVLDVPVAVAVRPLAATLSVSQGKGYSIEQAFVSAAMEAVELWHAENQPVPIPWRATPPCDLDLSYEIGDLDQQPGSLLTPFTKLDWTVAVGVVSGERVPLPVDSVCLLQETRWRLLAMRSSSNGLASGNCWTEAALHGLYELIERDAIERAEHAGTTRIDPASVSHPLCAELIGRIRNAGASVGLARVHSRFGVPVFTAQLWSPDFPVVATGSGAHAEPGIAALRSLTEAAQSRLTGISGSRDDIPDIYGDVRFGRQDDPLHNVETVPWTESAGIDPAAGIEELLAQTARIVRAVTGADPLTVDLSSTGEFAVVRVVAPGLGFTGRRSETCHVK